MIAVGVLLLVGLALLVAGLACDAWERAPVVIAPGAVCVIAAAAQVVTLFTAVPA